MPNEWYSSSKYTYNGYPVYGPSQSDLSYYMSGYYPNGTARPGNKYYNVTSSFSNYSTKVIYYRKLVPLYNSWGNLVGYQDSPHFSLVQSYNSSGGASTIRSKWGCRELVQTSGMYFNSSGPYGYPTYFFN